MKDWRALPSKGGVIGIILTALALVLLGLAIWLTWQSATATEVQQAITSEDAPTDQPELVLVQVGANLGTFGLGLLSVGLLGLVLWLAYQTRRFFALRYSLDRNAIRVDMGDRQAVIPLANIRYVVSAQDVLNQMRQKVYGGSEAGQDSVSTGPMARAYPRRAEEASTKSDPALEGVAVQDEKNPSYQLTQTAAADSSLEYLEKIEIEPAQFVEIEAPAMDDRPGQQWSKAESEETDELAVAEIEEGQIVEIEPARLRTLAVNFDERPANPQDQPDAQDFKRDRPARPGEEEPDFVATGSVNFGVKRPLFGGWPGFHLNQAQVASLGPVQFYSTRPLAETLLIRTQTETYALSPRDSTQFITEYKLRRRLGATTPSQEGIVPGAFLNHPLWHDRLGRGLILAGVLLNLVLWFILLWRYDDLPITLRIHFNKLGQVDRLGDKGELMFLPFIGLLAVVGNSLLGAFLHPKERIPAYLLYGGAILIQFLAAIAVFVILAVS